ncbi:MAG: carboxypeptidase-like regulatory domain-containing protein, partial [Candidatus Subteraquimicrobiales bacterium]|nr:carboxypeptidase-like regulatory domain-containing protein [Candidatus Subteraquimicrobiales bacterium]
TKVDAVPDPADLRMIPDDILIAFYDIALELEGSAPPGIVSKFSFDGKNSLNVDKTRGLGSRGPQRKPKAQSRELKIEFESTLEPETIELIEKAEYGEIADSPSACKLYRLPLKLTIEFCEDANDSMEVYFPECIFSVEYEASGADEIDVKFNLQTIGSSIVTLLDGTTDVVTDMYVKLINNQPEIKAGAVGTSTVTIGLTDLGDAISGAIVTLTNRATGAVINSSATSAGGAATLSTVPLGSYDVSVVSGANTLEVTPTKFSVNESTETLTITKNTSLVSVTLHDGVTAVEGAVVTLTSGDDEYDSGATSALGAATIDHVPYGTYDVTVVDDSTPVDVTPVTLVVDGASETLTLLVDEE